MKTAMRMCAGLVIVIISFLSSGCASFPKHTLPELGQVPPPADPSQAVKAGYQFTSGWNMGSGRRSSPQNVQQILEKEFVDVLKESGYFATVSPGQEGGIIIDADMLNHGSKAAATTAGIIGGLSLTTIPVWATDNFKLKVKVRSAAGQQAEYTLDDSVTTVIWFPLIIATPFKGPASEIPDLRKNMYRHLILKMQQDGLLPPAKK